MRQDIKTHLKQLRASMSKSEWRDLLNMSASQVAEKAESLRVEAELLKRKAEQQRRETDAFAAWADQERAKGRPEHELIFGNFQRETGRVSQEEIDADERWLKGPHCPEDQVYLDALDECGKLRATHRFLESELIAAMVKRMGPEFGDDEPAKIAAAERILARWMV